MGAIFLEEMLYYIDLYTSHNCIFISIKTSANINIPTVTNRKNLRFSGCILKLWQRIFHRAQIDSAKTFRKLICSH